MLDDSSQGFLGTYVDDLLASGSTWIVEQTLAKIAYMWECSTLEILDAEKFKAGKHPPQHHGELRFCGFEIRMDSTGLILHQRSYTQELMKKHNVNKTGSLSAFAHVDDVPDEEITDLNDLQKARAIVGELHWLTARTKIDLTYHVGVTARLLHRRPKFAVHLFEEILKYVKATEDYGLHYKRVVEENFGPGDGLRYPRDVRHVEVYSDASFAPSAGQCKSVQGTLVSIVGCTVMWPSSRQTLVSQSMAKAELIIGMMSLPLGMLTIDQPSVCQPPTAVPGEHGHRLRCLANTPLAAASPWSSIKHEGSWNKVGCPSHAWHIFGS